MRCYKWLVIFSFLVEISALGDSVQYRFRFIEYDHYQVKGGLPPELSVTFKLACNEKLVRVLREEKARSLNGKVLIAVGGIVAIDDGLDCIALPAFLEASAGKVFSGRDYEVARITR